MILIFSLLFAIEGSIVKYEITFPVSYSCTEFFN